jgi:hypothetical protein
MIGRARPYRFLLLVLSAALAARAEVIDRMVAVVDGHIITASDLRQEREIRKQLGEKPIEDDLALAKQLADQYLIERQIIDYPNIDVTDREIEAELAKRAPSATATPSAPAVREAVRRRLQIQKFFEVKFRQSIRLTDEEVRKYYEDVFVPEARARGIASIPPLADSDITQAIRQNLVQEKLDHEVTVWLEAIRRRSTIETYK